MPAYADFEDPERFVPPEQEFPVEPDIEYVLGVRLERWGNGVAWCCPHDRKWAMAPLEAAQSCLANCDGEESGYDPSDPKHPGYYDRYAEQADLDRKRAKGE